MNIKFSIATANIVSFVLRKIFGRSGETLPGRILLFLRSDAISILSKNKRIILVSGTNGKTTTTKVLVGMIEALGPVASSASGSNLKWGVAGALLRNNPFAVLEIDELYLPEIYVQTNPEVVLLLNLTRDQLHRMHEVKKVAERWHQMIDQKILTTFVIDIDDPFLNFATSSAKEVVRVSFGGRKHPDGAVCPRCGGYLNWVSGIYLCECGLTNEIADFRFDGGSSSHRNLILAQIAGEQIGAPRLDFELSELARSEQKLINSRLIEIRLTKNPASWTEALNSVTSSNVIIVLNARQVDGIDTSWLWDVSFAQLKGKKVVVTGERALDMVYRLHVEGIETSVVSDFDSAVKEFPEKSDIYALTSYTAYFELVGR